jgi:hypothetical protein
MKLDEVHLADLAGSEYRDPPRFQLGPPRNFVIRIGFLRHPCFAYNIQGFAYSC